jgi:hypothetical protein
MAAEIEKPSSLLLIVAVTGALLLALLGAIALAEYAGFAMQDELARKVLTRPSPELAALRERELARVSLYQWVDRKQGIVRIPVDEALTLVLHERQTAADTGPRRTP